MSEVKIIVLLVRAIMRRPTKALRTSSVYRTYLSGVARRYVRSEVIRA